MEYNMRKRKLSRILCESYSHFCPLNYIDRLWEEKTLLLASASGRRIPLWPTGRLGVGSTRSSWQPVDCLIGFPFRLYLDTIACFDNFGCSGLKETPDQNQVNRVVKITRPFSTSVKKRVRRTPQALAGISLDPVQRLVKTGSRDCFLFCSKCSTAEAERYQIAIFETAAGSLYSLQPNQTLYQATFYNVQVWKRLWKSEAV